MQYYRQYICSRHVTTEDDSNETKEHGENDKDRNKEDNKNKLEEDKKERQYKQAAATNAQPAMQSTRETLPCLLLQLSERAPDSRQWRGYDMFGMLN